MTLAVYIEDILGLTAPWQNGTYKNKNTTAHSIQNNKS